MHKLLLIDGNNIGYAAMYQPALSRLQHQGTPTGSILGLAQSVMRLSALFPEALPVVLWDGHAQWRQEIWPEYKANRKDTPEKVEIAEKWRLQSPLAQALLLHMGVPQVRAADAEADDLAHQICNGAQAVAEATGMKTAITLVSNDRDWLQALSPTVDWFSPITDKSITLDDLLQGCADGFSFLDFQDTREFLLTKAIEGDSSDNIPGVPGVGVKTALKLLHRHGGLDGIVHAVSSGAAKDTKSRNVAENLEQIHRNLQIMDWRQAPAPKHPGMVREAFDSESCGDFCASLGMDRLAKNLGDSSNWAERERIWPVAVGLDIVEQAIGLV